MGKGKVLAAMSGGVDSSLTAALLVEQGYEVTGTIMQLWPQMSEEEEARHGGCCGFSAADDARRVAYHLDIPFHVMNLREVFEDQVIDYFTDEYVRGRTPNPCIACNKFIKFDALMRKALALGCDYVATGHYARLEQDQGTGRYLMRRPKDRHKDQTYTLYGLTQEQLAHTLFPLGDFLKTETRAMAKERGLLVHNKPDSQEICFVKDNDYTLFLKERVPEKLEPGLIKNRQGEVLGEHEGIAFYTIGQRRGLGITAEERLYVIDLDPQENTVIVGPNNHTFSDGLVAGDLNWIAIDRLDEPRKVTAKIRYNSPDRPAVIEPLEEGTVRVIFEHAERAVTPGQSIVFYDDDLVIGGGTIERVLERVDDEPALLMA